MENISEIRIKQLRDEKNFFGPILKMLQENGGELESISQIDKLIPAYTFFTDEDVNYSKITKRGNKYTPYWFGRNFALKNLQVAGYITYGRGLPVKLTADGLKIDVGNLDFERDIYSKTMPYWDKKAQERKAKKNIVVNTDDENDSDDMEALNEDTDQEWRSVILDSIKNLDPYKFEQFSRGLLKKMGFDIDPVKGIRRSGDGGIDGFAYCLDNQSLKTTRVVIQCKKFANNSVGSPDINNLRGAVDTHRADYGIFITTSYYSKDAVDSSRAGGTPITLIDGNQLVDLMIKYKYKVKEVTIYTPDQEYFGED